MRRIVVVAMIFITVIMLALFLFSLTLTWEDLELMRQLDYLSDGYDNKFVYYRHHLIPQLKRGPMYWTSRFPLYLGLNILFFMTGSICAVVSVVLLRKR